MLSPLALQDYIHDALALDMCASPGGKSSFLGVLGQGLGQQTAGLVLANEPNRERHQTLKRNLARLQLPGVATCQYTGEAMPLPDACCDAVLLDPPCSGWGTTDKHPRAAALWQGEKIAPLVSLQRQLLAEAVRLLPPGGVLAYSTCTTNVQENEEQVLFAQDELGLELLPLPAVQGFHFAPPMLERCQGCLRVDQERSQAQGHFVALLRKPAAGAGQAPPPGELPGAPLPVEVLQEAGLEEAVSRLGQGELRAFGENVHFLRRQAARLPESLRWQGPQVGRLARGLLRPLPRARLLLPQTPRPGDFVAEDPQTLVRLCSGQSLEAPDTAPAAPQGLCGLYYRGLGLGWLKRKGRRLLWAER